MGAGLAQGRTAPSVGLEAPGKCQTVWKDMFVLQVPLLEKVLRTALVYSLILVLVHLGG